MAGSAKRHVKRERDARRDNAGFGSSSGNTSSSGKASRSAPASHVGSVTSSRGGRFDGNRDSNPPSRSSSPSALRNPATSRVIVDPKNFDLGMSQWSVARGYDAPEGMPVRPKPCTLGQPAKVALNTFLVKAVPKKTVYQFDVMVGSGAEKRGLIKKVWASKAVKQALGNGWIFDGNKLAWSMNRIDRELKLTVDLDAEEGRQPRAGKENKHRILIRQTNPVAFNTLTAYLEGKTSFDNSVLEAINFFDHMLRETPSLNYTQIKRNFFAKGQQRYDLGSAVEAFKGVYQSLRIVHGGPGKGAGLSINVDVANGIFWKEQPLHLAAVQLTDRRDIPDLLQSLRSGHKGRVAEDMAKKFKRLHVIAKHRGKGSEIDRYTIERIIWTKARDFGFERDGKKISVYDHFAKEYNVRLQYPDLPLVKMTKGTNTVLPMEVLFIESNTRYVFKCNERQTANMIKVAVTPPKERWDAVEHGLKMLGWKDDPVLRAFGVDIDTNRTVVDARVLPAPTVKFGSGEAKPGTSGRWDLKGKKFLTPNAAVLKSWGVCVVPSRRGGKPDRPVVENFIHEFIKIYTNHGGRVENKQPYFCLATGDDIGTWVTQTWNGAGNQSQSRPQMLVFILPDKDSNTYGRIKRSADCRYGVVSQCMQYAHVQKCQPQYISNVCMKFNAKLGGSTCRAVGQKSGGPTGLFSVPTVIIGADVSHGAPGVNMPSMAAFTVSMDKLATRYAGACETNGYRVEMITTDNINSMLKPALQSWVSNVGGGKFPSRIIYIRDGVSEGEYQHVLQQEVADMKKLLKEADPANNIPFTVIIGSKRHHVRFFPQAGDRNGNAFPGTLVESGVTHPYEHDFYFCGHAALKGTARPVHYQVLLNECKMGPEEIYTLCYEHVYQYARATTPISQHPAIYYAHIVSNRAVPHDPKWGGSSDGAPTVASRPQGSQGQSGGSGSGVPTECEKLMPMPNQGGINTTMWYI